ncbi:hypothetical protein [Akkermansia sp. AKK6]
METKVMMISLCSLLAWGACAAEDLKNIGKQTEMMDIQEGPFKKATRVKNEVLQLQQDLKRFISAYEEKRISLEQLRNFYEERVKSFCLYYHKLSEDELAVLLDISPGVPMKSGFLWDMRVKLNDLTEIFMDEDQGDGYVWGNKSYTGPKEVVALKVFSDGMDDFIEWIKKLTD